MKKIMVTMADVPLDWDEVDHSSLRLVYHETRRILNQNPLTHQSFLAVTGAEVILLITFTVEYVSLYLQSQKLNWYFVE